jgi:dihydrofolate reductase
MKVKLIVAKAKNNVIGKDNDLIWHLPADMRFFTETTKGHIVIMGRRNWDSIPLKYRPLSNRINAVVSRNAAFHHPDCTAFQSLQEAINFYKDSAENFPGMDIYVIGGGQIYAHALENSLLDELYITNIDESFEGDTYFPEIDEENWDKTCILTHEIDEKNKWPFKVYHYIKH